MNIEVYMLTLDSIFSVKLSELECNSSKVYNNSSHKVFIGVCMNEHQTFFLGILELGTVKVSRA